MHSDWFICRSHYARSFPRRIVRFRRSVQPERERTALGHPIRVVRDRRKKSCDAGKLIREIEDHLDKRCSETLLLVHREDSGRGELAGGNHDCPLKSAGEGNENDGRWAAESRRFTLVNGS